MESLKNSYFSLDLQAVLLQPRRYSASTGKIVESMSKISSRISNMSANFKIGFTQYRQNSIYIMASANAELAILVDISRLDSHNTDRTLQLPVGGQRQRQSRFSTAGTIQPIEM
ncbi:uncharacterized protein LOC144484300 isoform X1 [Mustelus asterias]